jgi:hypothetical protein
MGYVPSGVNSDGVIVKSEVYVGLALLIDRVQVEYCGQLETYISTGLGLLKSENMITLEVIDFSWATVPSLFSK